MPRPRAPWWLFIVAASFLVHFVFATYCKLWEPESEGFHADYRNGHMTLREIAPDSPAAMAGLESADRAVSVDGQAVETNPDLVSIQKQSHHKTTSVCPHHLR